MARSRPKLEEGSQGGRGRTLPVPVLCNATRVPSRFCSWPRRHRVALEGCIAYRPMAAELEDSSIGTAEDMIRLDWLTVKQQPIRLVHDDGVGGIQHRVVTAMSPGFERTIRSPHRCGPKRRETAPHLAPSHRNAHTVA